jgi:hypothetical protein
MKQTHSLKVIYHGVRIEGGWRGVRVYPATVGVKLTTKDVRTGEPVQYGNWVVLPLFHGPRLVAKVVEALVESVLFVKLTELEKYRLVEGTRE